MSNRFLAVRIAGSGLTYRCADDDNLLRAGLREGIGLPYECNAGGCGSCKFELVDGELRETWADAPASSEKDRSRRRFLACQCVPLTDCEIRIRPEEQFRPRFPPRRLDATYAGRRAVTHDIHEFEFHADEPADFLPGQYAMATFAGTEQVRAYSMSNQPNAEGVWKFMIRRVPGGSFSSALFETLHPGARVRIDGPLGLAYLRDEIDRDIVCIAGGSGFAPIVSIVNGALSSQRLRERRKWVFYGGRGPADIPMFTGHFAAHRTLELHPAISARELDAANDWRGEVCLVHELPRRRLPRELACYEYYLAGPPPMIEAVVRMLVAEHHVPAGQIHYDRFF